MAELFHPPVKERTSDAQLWEKFKNGKSEAFEFIYQAHVQALFDYGMHIQADADLVKDAIQELFIHIWQRRVHLGNVNNIRNYLMVSLRYQILGMTREQNKSQNQILEKLSQIIASNDSPESSLIAQEDIKEQEHDLSQAIENLPPRQREIVYLLYYKNLSKEEVGEMMSINLPSVYTLTWKAIKSLKKHLRVLVTLLFPLLKIFY